MILLHRFLTLLKDEVIFYDLPIHQLIELFSFDSSSTSNLIRFDDEAVDFIICTKCGIQHNTQVKTLLLLYNYGNFIIMGVFNMFLGLIHGKSLVVLPLDVLNLCALLGDRAVEKVCQQILYIYPSTCSNTES